MALEVKDFGVMVDDVLTRIANSTNISNVTSGSVIRTIVEALLAENDIMYYQINQVSKALDIDLATGGDLDRLVKIFNVTRNAATKCTYATEKFGRSSALGYNITIPAGIIISTRADMNGDTIEFIVTDDTVLTAGQLSVDVPCIAVDAGFVHIPVDTLNVLNNTIVGIEYVTNSTKISGGSDTESDDNLRVRAKNTMLVFGKGTSDALKYTVSGVDGVLDVVPFDMARGVATVDLIVLTSTLPPSTELQNEISAVVAATKASGISVDVVYPTILNVAVTVTTTGYTDADVIGSGIEAYFGTLSVSDVFRINQMERYVLNACNNSDMDIATTAPAANVTPTSTQIIRAGVITINGVVWNG